MTASIRRWHFLVWMLYSSYELIGNLFVYREPGARSPLYMLLAWTTSMLLLRLLEFYACYLIIFPRFFRAGRQGQLLLALLGVVVGFIAGRYVLEQVVAPRVFGFANYNLDVRAWFYMFDNLLRSLPAILLSGAIWFGEMLLRREREYQQLRDEKRQADLAFLTAQLNPHFLYNTLNMLYSLAYPVAKPVAAGVLQLAELMRYMLREQTADRVPLTQEIDYLHNFLALYRLRFPNQFFVGFTITGEPTGQRLAPLLLIPFVENALKHGTLDDPAHPVCIQLTVTQRDLTFEVHNHILEGGKDASSGVGLANVRRRLALLYPERHTLHTGPAGKQFHARLHLTW